MEPNVPDVCARPTKFFPPVCCRLSLMFLFQFASVCPYDKKSITRWLEDMNFIFSCKKIYLMIITSPSPNLSLKFTLYGRQYEKFWVRTHSFWYDKEKIKEALDGHDNAWVWEEGMVLIIVIAWVSGLSDSVWKFELRLSLMVKSSYERQVYVSKYDKCTKQRHEQSSREQELNAIIWRKYLKVTVHLIEWGNVH